MEARITTLRELFQKDVRYLVPPFQRPYVWNQEEQWEPLWEDVRNTAERYLEALAAADGQSATAEAGTRVHFLGAVVAQQRLTSAAEIEARDVIDGQQRLTTLQLLIDAAQQAFEEKKCIPQARRLGRLVLNDDVYIEGESDLAFKIWPTTTDRDAFRQAMRNELPNEEYEESPIVQAHDFFREQIIEWLDESESLPQAAQALESVLAQLLQMVVIDLGHNDDPYVIFETLNARGTALLDSDLIKNFLMYEANRTDGSSLDIHERHLQFFEDPWWRQEVRQGRLSRPRVDVFLNYWLVMNKHEEVTATQVFPAFRDFAANSDSTVKRIAADLERISLTYRTLEETSDDSALGRFLYNWRVMQAGVLSPVLMWLLSTTGVGAAQLERSLRALESYLMRRMVCRMTTRGYSQLTLALLGQLHADGPGQADETIIRHLAGQASEAYLWPDDGRLGDAFRSLPLYRLLTRARLRMVLEGVEGQLRTPLTEQSQPDHNLSIEHVMPQHWQQHWPLDIDGADSQEAARRARMIHAIGNLTLVMQRLNATVSNGPWPTKRDALGEHSVLFLNKDLLDHAGDEWDEAAIEERGRRLAGLAAAAWPSAGAI